MKQPASPVLKISGWFFPLLLLIMLPNLPAGGGKEPEGSKPEKVTVCGKVRLTGSGPMTILVITGEDREWQIDQPEENKLMHLQQQYVTVTGKESSVEYFFANGKSAGRHYFLKDITVIISAK